MALLVVAAGSMFQALQLQSVLQDSGLAVHFISLGLWQRIVEGLGSRVEQHGDVLIANVELTPLLLNCLLLSLAAWTLGARWIARRRGVAWTEALYAWGTRGWLWWLLSGFWEGARMWAVTSGSAALSGFFLSTPAWAVALVAAAWISTGLTLASPPRVPAPPPAPRGNDYHAPPAVWIAAGLYCAIFAAMNCRLYDALLLPHGDSAMYEEHLWNLLHGKGFRSYLDNGRLFLGEHIQVIHLLLIPVYWLWPSQQLLEICQSAALAAGAFPVFWIARRHTGSVWGAACLAMAYLLYAPMQFLDIAIDFKTFRPNSFEIPLLLYGLDALERRKYVGFAACAFLCLLCQEDAAMVLGPLGLWIAYDSYRRTSNAVDGSPDGAASSAKNRKRGIAWGLGLAVFGIAYVALVIAVVLPWFRSGAEVHFTSYFSELGDSPGQILKNLVTQPGLFLGRLCSLGSVLFGLALLIPLGVLPLLSPSRLAVALPLWGVLSLNQISSMPVHHFHAPLVPILLWAAAAGLGNAPPVWGRLSAAWETRKGSRNEKAERRLAPNVRRNEKRLATATAPSANPSESATSAVVSSLDGIPLRFAAAWCLSCSVMTGIFTGLGPAGIGFWDPFSRVYWRTMYVPGRRALEFPQVLALVPPESRVASTDFVHPRFTHHARSYDYSDYRPHPPEDTDFLVIDTQHPYSTIKRPEDVKEYRQHPEQWKLLPDTTGGYFIVLQRIKPGDPPDDSPRDLPIQKSAEPPQ